MEKKYKVLIVDDVEMNRSLLADMLCPQYDILEAANGLEAIALLEKFHTAVSIVLLDIMMPEMDGFEMLGIMNKTGWITDIPVIMISAETSSQSIDKAYCLGATDYINRPFYENTVQRRVKNTIMLYVKQKMLEDMITQQHLDKEHNSYHMIEILSNILKFRNGECGAFNPALIQCLMDIEAQLRHAAEESSQSSSAMSICNEMCFFDTLSPGRQVSSRSLALLEQERTKYQFFASMSNEIQFEYNNQTDILTLSEWGARQLGLKEIIAHPWKDKELHQIIAYPHFLNFKKILYRATPPDPVIKQNYPLLIHGEPRWYRLVARPLWDGEESQNISRIIGKFIDIHDEYVELKSFKQLALEDPLTQLLNSRAARKAIEENLKQDSNQKFAMLLFDLDNFKLANDRYGHLFGDEILKHVGRLILESIRNNDVAARVGGDEFMVFLSYRNEEKALVRRIFNSLAENYHDFSISVSLGISLYPEQGTDYDRLFHCADQALYTAKKRGRKQYCFYDDTLRHALSVLSPMDNELSSIAADEVSITAERKSE